jgi:hypothetical protein
MTHSFLWLLLMLCAGHALCDFPLQSDILALGKNRHKGYGSPRFPWWQLMLAHCLIHGGTVALITGNVWCGIAELVIHFFIDYWKCEGAFSFEYDQSIHYLMKLGWAVATMAVSK